MRRTITAAAVALPTAALLAASAAPAGACGGLVGENGTIELVRTTTLAAYSDGIERYVTAFEFTGEGGEVGSIVPLPDVPTEVTRAGDWTLQRLAREVAPPVEEAEASFGATADEGAGVDVILETEVDALDITVISGGGDAVGQWALDNGFLLTPDAPEVLDYYAERSPVFMAAKFDAQRAADLGQGAGDSTPIMATIPTDDPWVPADMWLSYLTVDAPAAELDYDLAVSNRPGVTPSLVDAGVDAPRAVPVLPPGRGVALWPLAAGVGAGLGVLAVGWPRQRREPGVAAGGAVRP
jgi:hypothetical protein